MESVALAGVSGPVFLLIYCVAIGACLWAAWAWRKNLRQPDNDGADVELDLYQLAYLVGGAARALAAAFATLLGDDSVAVHGDRAFPRASARKQARDGHPLERAVAADIDDPTRGDDWRRWADAHAQVEMIRYGLEERGLVIDRESASSGRTWPPLLLLATIAAALPRLQRGVTLHRPVGGLVLLMILAGIAAVRMLLVMPERTLRGDAVVRRHRERASARRDELSPAQRVALFGPGNNRDVVAIFGWASDGSMGGGCGGGAGGDGGSGGGCGGGGCGGGCGGCGGCGG